LANTTPPTRAEPTAADIYLPQLNIDSDHDINLFLI